MKKLLIAITLMLSASVAFASDYESTTTDVNVDASSSAETFSGSVAIAESNGVSGSYNSYSKSDLGDMVGAAIAPALTTTLTETCMGSTSIGAGWSGGGVSFGTTWRDSACVRRLDARELKNIHPNFAIAAKEMMCDSQKVYNAFKRAGMPCVYQEDKEDGPKKVNKSTASTVSLTKPVKSVNTDVSSINGFF